MMWITALPGEGWTFKTIAGLFAIATRPGQACLIWKDGTVQSILPPAHKDTRK